jgi:hypothetical protein
MNPRPFLILLGGSLLCAAALHAEDTAPAKTESASEPYELKNRSRFSCEGEGVRAPFWPIGWVHRQGISSAVTQSDTPRQVLDAKDYRVTSILLGSGSTPSLAVINGRAYSEGEFLKMPRGTAAAAAAVPGSTAPVRTRVQRISDGFIILQRDAHAVTVALYRPEIALKKIEDPLLDEER